MGLTRETIDTVKVKEAHLLGSCPPGTDWAVGLRFLCGFLQFQGRVLRQVHVGR